MRAEALAPEATHAGILGLLFSPWTLRGESLASVLRRKAMRQPAKAVASAAGDEVPSEVSEVLEGKTAMHPVLRKLALLNFLAKAAEMEKLAPPVSERQRRFMGAELRRKREGKRTVTGMSERQLREFAARPEDRKLPERVEKSEKSAQDLVFQKKAALMSILPMLSFVPGTGRLSRIARGVGVGAMLSAPAVHAARAPQPSQMIEPRGMTRMASLVESLLEMTKEAFRVPALRRGTSAPRKLDNPSAPATRRESGPAPLEAPVSAGATEGGHVNRPRI